MQGSFDMTPPDTKEASGVALRTLAELVRDVAAAPDEAGVRTAVAEALDSAFGYERIAIFLAASDDDLVLRTMAGPFPAEVRPGVTIRPGQGLVGVAFERGAPVVSGDTAADDRYRDVPGLDCLSEAAIPVRIDSEVVGVLDVQSAEREAFDEGDVDVLESVAGLMGVAVARVRLHASLERRRADAEEATSRWRQAVETKDRFLTAVSHEFRTPLTSIRSFAEILLTHGVEDAETTREFVSIIHDESMRMSRLVDDLLDFSKIQAGRMTWAFGLNDLSEAVRRSASSVASIAALKRVTIQVEDAGPALSFVFDLDRVIQVLVNLLSNAVKHSPEGERILLIVESWEGGAKVVVRDRGPGVEPEHRTRVFERYQQVGDRDHRPGTGLGLSISREIVLAHGGRIWADASPEGGGEFVFTLPAIPPETGVPG
jgi:signal transduction histidine kinase